MAVPVDYRCDTCRSVAQRLEASPPPPVVGCSHCGAEARRLWAPVGLLGRAAGPSDGNRGDPGRLCREHPDIPGLCLLQPSAARALVALARGDGRSLEAEYSRQEQVRETTGEVPPVLAQGHGVVPPPPAEDSG